MISALARAIIYTPPNNPKIHNQKSKIGDSKFNEKVAELETAIKESVCQYPNYTEIIKALIEKGGDIEHLAAQCKITVGVPCKPMLAKPTKGIQVVLQRFEGMAFTCEYKYDGYRGQIHFSRAASANPVSIYSRNLENLSPTYPDVTTFIKESVKSEI